MFDLWLRFNKMEEILDYFVLAIGFFVRRIGEVSGEFKALEDPALSTGMPAFGDEGACLNRFPDSSGAVWFRRTVNNGVLKLEGEGWDGRHADGGQWRVKYPTEGSLPRL